MKYKLPIALLVCIIIFIVFSIYMGIEKTEYQEQYKANFPANCAFIKELEFEGKIVLIDEPFSSGSPDYVEVACSILNYPTDTINNEYFEKLNGDILRIRIFIGYDNRIFVGDILKSDKGDYKVYRVTPSKKKMDIGILENCYNYKCSDFE